MKKLIFTAVIIFSCLTFKNANAQIHFSVGVNIGSQPDWGPVGYDHAAYYYIPDVDGYYDVSAHQYIYLDNNVWVHRQYLPYRYRNYDLYHGYKVVINDRDPWMRHSVYRTRYAGYGAAETKPSYATVAMTGIGTTGEAGRTTIGAATAEIVVAIIMTMVGIAAKTMVIGATVAVIITTMAGMVEIIIKRDN